jgi:hypothetical protein
MIYERSGPQNTSFYPKTLTVASSYPKTICKKFYEYQPKLGKRSSLLCRSANSGKELRHLDCSFILVRCVGESVGRIVSFSGFSSDGSRMTICSVQVSTSFNFSSFPVNKLDRLSQASQILRLGVGREPTSLVLPSRKGSRGGFVEHQSPT